MIAEIDNDNDKDDPMIECENDDNIQMNEDGSRKWSNLKVMERFHDTKIQSENQHKINRAEDGMISSEMLRLHH